MMVEEEHISFRSDSLMVDGVEDYSHQIAEMIGLRNESNFNEAGVSSFCFVQVCSLLIYLFVYLIWQKAVKKNRIACFEDNGKFQQSGTHSFIE